MNYRQVEIGSVVTLRQGFAINKNTKHHISEEPTDLPLLRIADMKDGSQNVFVKDTIPPHFIAKSEDIIYTRTGQVGLVFTNQFGVIHNNCFTVTPNDEGVLSRKYLYYALNSEDFYTKANNLASGAAQPDLPHGAFNSISIYLPPIDVQMRIADMLSAYDDLIENNQKQIKLLEEAARRLYKEWFVDLRFPGYEDTPIVDGLPQGWKKASAESFFEITIGKTPPRAESQWFTDMKNGIPWASISDMGESSIFIYETSEGLTKEAIERHNVKLISADNVLLSFKLTVGRVSISTTEMCTNEAIAHFRLEDSNYREYVYCYLKDYNYDSLGSTSSISKAVNSKIIKAMPFVMPSYELIKAFTNTVAPIFDQIKNKQKSCLELKQARDRLLPKLMSGELEV